MKVAAVACSWLERLDARMNHHWQTKPPRLMEKQKRNSRRTHISGTATARGLQKRVWDLDVEATLLSFPKSGKGMVWEQLMGAHFGERQMPCNQKSSWKG